MTNISYRKIDIKSVKYTKNLYVHINDNGVKKYVSIKDLAILDGSSMLAINTINELTKAAKLNSIYTLKSNGAKDKQVVLIDSNVYEAVKVVGASIDSEDGYFISTTIQGQIPVAKGYERIVRIKRNKNKKEIVAKKQLTDTLKDEEYLSVKLENGTETYLSREEIVFSSSKKALGISKLSSLKKKTGELRALEDLNHNKIVEIDLTKAYVFENYTEKNQETGEDILFREEVVDHTYRTVSIKDGQPVIETQSVDPIYTERRYLKVDDQPIIRMNNYEVTNNKAGDYMKVVFAGDHNDTLISKDELYLDSSLTTRVSDFSEDLVGKVLYTKSNDANTHFKVTAPITAVQAKFTYTKKKYLQETDKKEDICADGAYLKLKNGKYVKENESIRPICYEYTNKEEKPEAYLAKVTDSEKGNITIIIPASVVKDNNKDSFKYGKYTIYMDKIYGLKKSCKKMSDCDVVQTSTDQDKFESCEVIRTPGIFHGQTHERKKQPINNIEEVLSNLDEEFRRAYKEGKYTIEQILDENGKFVDIVGKRYVFNEYLDLPDYSNGYSEYAYTKPNGKYDLKKGMKEGFKSWAQKAGIASLFVYGVGWPFLAVSTTFALVTVGALAASALLVPAIQFGKAAVHNRKNRVPKDKTKCQNKGTLKEILKDLKDEHQKAVSKDKNFTQDDELRFNERMENLERRAFFLAGGMTMADFKVQNGKMAPVGSSNYEAFKNYEKEMYKKEAELKKLLKDMKKGKITREEYNAKYNEHQELLYNYVAKGIFVPTDKKYKEVIDAIRTTKGFVIAKYGHKENLTDKEKNIKESLKNKKLKISKNFKCSIGKLKGDELETLTNNLIVVANNNPVDYDRIIIQSSYEQVAQEVVEEQVVEEQVAEESVTAEQVVEQVTEEQTTEEQVVEEQATEETVTEDNEDKKNDVKSEGKKTTKKKKSNNTKPKKEDNKIETDKLIKSSVLKIDGLDFIIAKIEKHKVLSQKQKGAYEEKKEVVIVSEKLNESSLDNLKKAIEVLKKSNDLSASKKNILNEYIKRNLNKFSKNKAKYADLIPVIEDCQKQYNQFVSLRKDTEKTV